jgi:hypothetical protein
VGTATTAGFERCGDQAALMRLNAEIKRLTNPMGIVINDPAIHEEPRPMRFEHSPRQWH